jgi:hypothetical protein
MTNIATAVVSQDANLGQISQLCGDDKFAIGIDKNGNLSVVGVEQEILDAALVEYNSNLDKYEIAPVRAVRKDAISQTAADFISETYPSFRRELFIALAEEARNSGLVNRVAYINQLLTWAKTVVAETIVAGDEIDVETDIQIINDYVVDFTQFDATNPNITIKAALEILD